MVNPFLLRHLFNCVEEAERGGCLRAAQRGIQNSLRSQIKIERCFATGQLVHEVNADDDGLQMGRGSDRLIHKIIRAQSLKKDLSSGCRKKADQKMRDEFLDSLNDQSSLIYDLIQIPTICYNRNDAE